MDYRHVLKRDTVLDGKYRIERVLGAGGFGITYEALDLGLAAPVAVKEYYPALLAIRDTTLTVRPGTAQDRPMFEHLRSSFLREARTLAQFHHPAIVGVLNVFEWHGTAYMVMKLESGLSFKAWLADLGRPARQAELDAIAAPLLDALEVMHRAEFLHRDIAPDNIIIRDDGSPVILDFGASRRVMGAGQVALTGVVKRGYSPQEQYAGEARTQGPWTDIYATAATLYLAVTGNSPHDATERMLEDDMPPAAEAAHAGIYRQQFLDAIDWGMRLRPKERPQSIGEWRRAMFGDHGLAPTVARSEPVALAAEVVGDDSRDVRSGPRTGQSHSLPHSSPATRERSGPSEPIPPPATWHEAIRGRPLLLSLAVLAALTIGGMLAFGLGVLGRGPPSSPLAPASAPVAIDQQTTEREVAAARQAETDRVTRERDLQREREAAEARTREAAARKAAEQRTANAAPAPIVPAVPAPAALPPSPAAQAELVAKIRRELNRVGCKADATGPAWVDADQKALERFARHAGGNVAFTALNAEIAETVGSYVGQVCPSTCGRNEKPEIDRCTIAAAPSPSDVPLCSQINERAQLGTLTEDDRQRLRSGRCR